MKRYRGHIWANVGQLMCIEGILQSNLVTVRSSATQLLQATVAELTAL